MGPSDRRRPRSGKDLRMVKVASVGKMTSGRLDVVEDDFGKVGCGGETGLADTWTLLHYTYAGQKSHMNAKHQYMQELEYEAHR